MLTSLLSIEQPNYLCFVQLKIEYTGTKKQMSYALFNVLVATIMTLVKRAEI